jgi:F0F1-type ATP synthase membrane subunit b/b'
MLIFDTFDYAKKLQRAGLTEEQASVHVEALRTLVEHDLATKQDIANVQRDIAELRKETQQSIESLRKETQQSIESLRKETQQGIESLRKETDVKLAELNVSLVKEIATAKAETIKWVAGMLVAQGAVVAKLVKLL